MAYNLKRVMSLIGAQTLIEAISRATVIQRKTDQPVAFEITEHLLTSRPVSIAGRPGVEATEIQPGSMRKARFCGISQRGRDRVPLPFHEHSD